tara:strand:- start:1819 stop:2376 length:558 start_codon:yes stop_codon:yes gene_type:complete
MKLIILLFSFFLITNCSKPKTVLICGDHICVNNSEAQQYFEENLTIEVKIIDKKKKKEINLVELNLNINEKNKKEVSITNKENTRKNLKVLSTKDVTRIKKDIKKKQKVKKNTNKKDINNDRKDKSKTKKRIIKESPKKENNVSKKRENVVDICTILDKCSIDEISKYLIMQGKKKGFPDITTRQ